MNKALFTFILFIIGLVYIFNVDKPFTEKFTLINHVKQFYVQQVLALGNFSQKYFNQANTIEQLRKENQELSQYRTLYTNANTSLNVLKNAVFKPDSVAIDLKLTNVLSYVNFDDYSKVWLDYPKQDEQILGLISNNYAAGIVKNFAGKSMALLNGNEKANYAVFIGENKAPGIAHGSDKNNLVIIKYIPIWIEIQKGDEVITSGMDNIFFQGLKVGKVIKINKLPDMQEALISPYAQALKQEHFYVYKKITTKEEPQPKPLSKKP
jgi:rod shape-determining protein MreC